MKSAAVDVKTFSEARANLKAVMDSVVDNAMPVIISRRKAEPVVMVSLSEWNALQETAYLNCGAANRARLDKSITQAGVGDLIEVEFGEDGALHSVGPEKARETPVHAGWLGRLPALACSGPEAPLKNQRLDRGRPPRAAQRPGQARAAEG